MWLGLTCIAFGQSDEGDANSIEADSTTIRGRVSGQSETGEYLGIISKAKVEILDASGAPAASTETDSSGYYEITGLQPGAYTYKVTATGFADDDAGRGVMVPKSAAGHVLDFILPRGKLNTVRSASLQGHVWFGEEERKPIEGAMVAAQKISGGRIATTRTDAEGAYSFQLEVGEWRVSAVTQGSKPKVNANSVTVGGTSSSDVDFVFLPGDSIASTLKAEVFAVISVFGGSDDPDEDALPAIRFVNVDSGEPTAASVKKVNKEKLENLGITSNSAGVAWYEAEPEGALSQGQYFVEGERTGIPLAKSSSKVIQTDLTTWFDLHLDRVSSLLDPDHIFTSEDEIVPGIRGRVSGQNDFGEYLGVITGATIEIVNPEGAVIATNETKESGFYEFADLGAGTWTYRVSAPGFTTDDAGRGFVLSKGSEMQVMDFILSRGKSSIPDSGILKGVVLMEKDGKRIPLPNASITLKPEENGAVLELSSNSKGEFELTVEATRWKASVESDGFSPLVYPTEIVVPPGGEASVEFFFTEADIPKIPAIRDVFAMLSVERSGSSRGAESIPEVDFISKDAATRIPGKVRRLGDEELLEKGVNPGSGNAHLWDWYEVEPGEEVPLGSYFAEARLGEFTPDFSEVKEVVEGFPTWFDLMLDLPESDNPLDPVSITGDVKIHGRVSGQSEEGDYEGVIRRAQVELFEESGELVASASTSPSGYYEINNLKSGNYIYRVSASPYNPDDDGRGFHVPEGAKACVQDFLLTRKTRPPEPEMKPGRLFGQVLIESDETRIPVVNAVVSMRSENGIISQNVTNEEGSFSAVVPAGQWRIAASSAGMKNLLYPDTVTLDGGTEQEIALVFPKEVMIMPDLAQVYVVVAVERFPAEEGAQPKVTLAQHRLDNEPGKQEELLMEPLGSDPTSNPLIRELGWKPKEGNEENWQYFLYSPAQGGVSPAAYVTSGSLAGYRPVTLEPRSAHSGLETIVDINLEKIRPEILIEVHDSEGDPISGADLTYFSIDTGRSGGFEIPAPTNASGTGKLVLKEGFGRYKISAKHEAYQNQEEEISVDRSRAELEIRLFKEGEMRTLELTGVVADKKDKGKGVANAEILLVSATGTSLPPILQQPLRTDASGKFSASEVPEGKYHVAIAAEGYLEFIGEMETRFKMEPLTFLLDPRNLSRDNWIKRILEEGWGKQNIGLARQFHQNGLREDPLNCKVDYAMALAGLKGNDWDSSNRAFVSAIRKGHTNIWWDRACEGYIWKLMFKEENQMAVSEMRRIAQSVYKERPANSAGHETAFTFGVAVGVLNHARAGNGGTQDALDRDLMAAFKEPLLTSYQEGKIHVRDLFDQLTQRENDDVTRAVADASAKKKALDDTAGKRLLQIDGELRINATNKTSLTNTYGINRNSLNGIVTANQAEIRRIQGLLRPMDQRFRMLEATPAICEGCRAEGVGSQPGCQYCAVEQRKKTAALLGMQREAQPFANEINRLQGLINQANGNLRQLDAKYQKDSAIYRGIDTRLYDEKRRLEAQMATAPNPDKIAAEIRAGHKRTQVIFTTYSNYPSKIEQRKAELLQWVTRKAKLPPRQGQNNGR